jgi:hypothetical protein
LGKSGKGKMSFVILSTAMGKTYTPSLQNLLMSFICSMIHIRSELNERFSNRRQRTKRTTNNPNMNEKKLKKKKIKKQ